MVEVDTDYEDWKVGDKIKWVEEKDNTVIFTIKRIDERGYIYWDDPLNGDENKTREINLKRVKYTKIKEKS